jgi:hypothetical protein
MTRLTHSVLPSVLDEPPSGQMCTSPSARSGIGDSLRRHGPTERFSISLAGAPIPLCRCPGALSSVGVEDQRAVGGPGNGRGVDREGALDVGVGAGPLSSSTLPVSWVSSSVVKVSSWATGGSFTAATVIATVAVSMPPLPSETSYCDKAGDGQPDGASGSASGTRFGGMPSGGARFWESPYPVGAERAVFIEKDGFPPSPWTPARTGV